MLSVLTGVLLLLTAVFYPPVAAGIYILFASDVAAGMGGVADPVLSQKFVLLGGLISGVMALRRLWRNRRLSAPPLNALAIGGVAAVMTFWVALSVYASTGSQVSTLLGMAGSSIYGVIIALAYFQDRLARICFLAVVTIHLAISAVLIFDPYGPLVWCNAVQYISSTSTGDEGLLGLTFEGMRARAQFANPVHLSFFGAVGLTTGFYLLAAFRRCWWRIFGILLVGLGIVAMLASLIRMTWVTLVVVALYLVFRSSVRHRRWILTGMVVAGLLFPLIMGALGRSLALPPHLQQAFTALVDIREYEYRFEGVVKAVNLIPDHLLWGVGSEDAVILQTNNSPHQAIVYYSALYGLPVGVAVVMMSWWAIATICSRRRLPEYVAINFGPKEMRYCQVIGILTISMSLSEGMSAGLFSWICLGIACVPTLVAARKEAIVQLAMTLPMKLIYPRPSQALACQSEQS